jgi:hypothetical protein
MSPTTAMRGAMTEIAPKALEERELDKALTCIEQCSALERAAIAWMRSLSHDGESLRADVPGWFDEFEAAVKLRDRARDERGAAALLYVHINEAHVRRRP